MARKAAKNVPGTERYRDERRRGGPRMHGREWHDHDEPHGLERVADNAGSDALLEAESGGDRTGMGARSAAARPTQSRERRKRTVPPSKGLPKRAAKQRAAAIGDADRVERARARKGRSKSPAKSGTRRKAAAKDARRI